MTDQQQSAIKQILASPQLLGAGGLLLIMLSVAAMVDMIPHGHFVAPAWMYATLGLFGVGLGIRQLRRGVTIDV